MNSNSSCAKKDYCKTIIRCNTNPTPVIFTSDITTETQIGSADICLKDIKNSCTKIDISTYITVTGPKLPDTTLSFQVFKAPCCAPTLTTPVGLPWILKPRATKLDYEFLATSFGFTVCDCTSPCNSCYCYDDNDCFIYSVKVTPIIPPKKPDPMPTIPVGVSPPPNPCSIVFSNTTVSLISTCNTCNF